MKTNVLIDSRHLYFVSTIARKQAGKCLIHFVHKSHTGWLENNQVEILHLTLPYPSVTLVYRDRDAAYFLGPKLETIIQPHFAASAV